jgi:methyl-accepting chemotaxis protein
LVWCKKRPDAPVQTVQSFARTIEEISMIATAISTSVRQHGEATGEIAPKVQASAQGIHEVSTDIGGVTKSAGETGRAAGHVLAATNDLALQPDALRRQVDDFLGSIRAVRASAPDPSAAKDGDSIEPLPTHAGGRDG